MRRVRGVQATDIQDEFEAAAARLTQVLVERRRGSGLSRTQLAERLRANDGSRLTSSAWYKRVKRAESGESRPCVEHLDDLASGGGQELVDAVRRAASLGGWGPPWAYWEAPRRARLESFDDFMQVLRVAGFGSDDLPKQTPSTVIWTHRLRQPHLVHAVFSLAASAALRVGLRVQLVVDDSPPLDGDPDALYERFLAAVDSWTRRGGATDEVEKLKYTDVLRSAGAKAMFDELERYLPTSLSLRDYLNIAKIHPVHAARDHMAIPAGVRTSVLLGPLRSWAVQDELIGRLLNGRNPSTAITLGGIDESIMWNRWRASASPEARAAVGHIYLEKMPVDGRPWDLEGMRWQGPRPQQLKTELVAAAKKVKRRGDHTSLFEWLFKSTIGLPSDLGALDLTQMSEKFTLASPAETRRLAAAHLESAADQMAKGICSWFSQQ